jgi:hypothetical protein
VYVDTSIAFGKPPPDPLPVSFPSGTKKLNLIVVLERPLSGEINAGYRISSNAGPLDTRPRADASGYTPASMGTESSLIMFAEAAGGSFSDGPYRAVAKSCSTIRREFVFSLYVPADSAIVFPLSSSRAARQPLGRKPVDFFERWFGWAPDGGNGTWEASFIAMAMFLATAVIVLAGLFVRRALRRGAPP